jgi:hypothetical protein
MKNKKQETKSKIRKKINDLYAENEYANLVQDRNRSRSITVGTSFGGTVELSMRGDHHSLWVPLQPVEVVELIEQLAAGVGLQIAMRPKQDFATWRGWNVDAEDRYWAGVAPWQLEDVSERQKVYLEEERKKLKLLADSGEKDKEGKKIEKEIKIQEKIQKTIQDSVKENLQKLRDNVILDSDEFKEYLNEKLDEMDDDD